MSQSPKRVSEKTQLRLDSINSLKQIKASRRKSGIRPGHVYGLATALTPLPESTKGGRLTRVNGVRFSIEWVDEAPNAAPEERATLCKLRIYVSKKNVCFHSYRGSDEAIDHVTIPAVHLAEGLATDWWSIFGGRDWEYSIRRHRTGFGLPDVNFRYDGSTFEVRGKPLSCENPSLIFQQAASEELSRNDAEVALSSFVNDVILQLDKQEVSETDVSLRWSRVSRSRSNPEETAFCEAVGALGFDPYAIPDDVAQQIEQAETMFSGDALIEFLAGFRETDQLNSALLWVDTVETRPREKSKLPELQGVCRGIRESARRNPNERG